MHALADGPNLGASRQSRQGSDRILGHHVVELAHQSLVGTEHHGTDPTGLGQACLSRHPCRPTGLTHTDGKPQLHRVSVVAQSAYRLFVLADTRSGQGLHGANDGLQIARTLDLAAKARGGAAHDSSIVYVLPMISMGFFSLSRT